MSNLQIFKNQEFGSVRTIKKKNEIWFVGKDVAKCLGYERPTKAIQDRVDNEDKDEVPIQDSMGRNQNTPIINESGLYSLVLSSKLPATKKFKRWVTSEVLPNIRKYGMYAKDELLDNPDLLIQVATELKKEREEKKLLQEQMKKQKPKVLFADAVSVAHTSILVGDLAKLIKQNGIDIGAKRLFAWLRENGYLIRRKGTDYNMPTQYSMDLGLFEVKETSITHSDGHISISKTPKITGKGQIYFINKFMKYQAEKEVACTK
ncbi:phage antirepressor [Clostridium botulinum]|uniref:phage antirepressor n=1 Tax=Clostridium botulinum TaxID=1491 RepID=UPI0007E167DD|nr:phage antirepressor KilAC domain-containing protein [Clostridium botulinum]KEI92666.1 antirepressor [Clostridium botulinum B2 275]